MYKELYSSESSTLNYLVTSTIAEQTVGANCVDTLVEYDSTGQLKEGLATEWSYDEATLTWTFKLRDAKWVDSTGAEVADVTAQDFVDALKYELTPEYESANVQNLFGIIANAKEYYNGLVYNGGTDDLLHIQITFRRRRRPDTDGFIRQLCMKGFPVCF